MAPKKDPPGLAQYLKALRQHESGSNYGARGRPGRTASGAYQYVDGTWNGYGGYAHASDAPQSVQDARAAADARASYARYGSWDLAATAHFTGHAVQPGSAEYTRRPPGPSSNPTPAEYVASIRKLMGSSAPETIKGVGGSPGTNTTSGSPMRGVKGGGKLSDAFTSSEAEMGGFDNGIGKKHTPGTEAANSLSIPGSVTAAGPNQNLGENNWWDLPDMDLATFNDQYRRTLQGNAGGKEFAKGTPMFDMAFNPGHGGGGDLGRAVSEIGRRYVGVPYVWGGTGPNGLDCSGLVQYVFGQAGVKLPRLSADQARSGPQFNPAYARAGDLIAWDNSSRNNGADHIAISLGNGYILEAPRTGLNVRVRKLTPEDLREAWAVRVKGDVKEGLKGAPPLMAAAKSKQAMGDKATAPVAAAKKVPAKKIPLKAAAVRTPWSKTPVTTPLKAPVTAGAKAAAVAKKAVAKYTPPPKKAPVKKAPVKAATAAKKAGSSAAAAASAAVKKAPAKKKRSPLKSYAKW